MTASNSKAPKAASASSTSRAGSAKSSLERKPSQQKPNNMNGPLYMQTAGNSNIVMVRRIRRKDDSSWRLFTQWMVENQIGLAFNLLALLFLAHYFIPKARSHTSKFFTLSYYNSNTGGYAHGMDDGFLITFFVVLFTGLRAATMEYVLAPAAKTWGVRKNKALARFCEQSWLGLYCTVFWSIGMYIYCNSPYFFNMKELWTNWPNREMDGIMKFYIIAQWSFWIQQILVIHVEERRKDHWQMLTHHFITCGLIFSCYCYHHTRVGNLILILMDIGDLLLAIAKCMKYTGFTTSCDIMFGVFLSSWVFCRHIVYNTILWSIYSHTPVVVPYFCFKGSKGQLEGPLPIPEGYGYMLEPFFDAKGLVCFNDTVKWAFLAPLIALQIITIAWFYLIMRVAIKVIRGDGAEDNRSEDEGEEEEDEYIYEEAPPLEAEVGVEDIDLKSWERRSGAKRQSSASGVSLPGHSDRKELLGRIGCDKQVE